MKNRILLCLLLINVTCVNAQEKEFIVDDNIKNVTNQVSEFQNQIMDGIMTASQTDKTFETDFIIKNEEYTSGSEDNYLKLKTNKALKVTSHWNILLNRLNNKQTKVSIKLLKAESGKTVLKLDQIVSKGKLEQNLKDYINNNKVSEVHNQNENQPTTQSEAIIKSLGNGYKLLEKDNYTIEFPAKWEMQCPGPFFEPFCITGPKEEEYVYINLIKEEDKENLNKGFSKYVKDQVGQLISNGQTLIKEEKIDGKTCRIEYYTTLDEKLKTIRYFYLIDNEVYLLTFCANDKFFNLYSKEATKIMNTLKINNKPIKI
ncbi:hypothetical protein AAEO57_20470 [Flavobacterium sp. DGU38]|uniref:DUF1795 domain-containing protein n=1 Tax=Flavobacterium calami TaxID=3139144 RepID=A0ABU9IUM7_9FLAO